MTMESHFIQSLNDYKLPSADVYHSLIISKPNLSLQSITEKMFLRSEIKNQNRNDITQEGA